MVCRINNKPTLKLMPIETNKETMNKKLDPHIIMRMGVKRGVIQMEIIKEKITQMKIMEEKDTLEEGEETQMEEEVETQMEEEEENIQVILEELQDTQVEEEEETEVEVEVETHMQHIIETYFQRQNHQIYTKDHAYLHQLNGIKMWTLKTFILILLPT